MKSLKGFLRLTRPANVVTAVADILAGMAISGYFLSASVGAYEWQVISLLIISTASLYAGGVVLNDVFDAELDAKERPERPIPSGLVSKKRAATGGYLLLALGIISALFVHRELVSVSFFLAIAIATGVLLYNKWCKHHFIAGPFTMGVCRGLNLLLGISIVPAMVPAYWMLAFVPVVYIAAITSVSRGEVHGNNQSNLYLASGLYTMVVTTLLFMAIAKGHGYTASVWIAGFGLMIFPPLIKAKRQPSGRAIGKAVKAGVLALIWMNAAWAAVFGQLYLSVIIILLLPLSILLARFFAVT